MKSEMHIGPQGSRAQQQGVLEYIEIGQGEGAGLVAQAQLLSDGECKDGFFAPATLPADVSEDVRIAQEEMFSSIGEILETAQLLQG